MFRHLAAPAKIWREEANTRYSLINSCPSKVVLRAGAETAAVTQVCFAPPAWIIELVTKLSIVMIYIVKYVPL